MHTTYLFLLQKEWRSIFEKNPKLLYDLLKSLYHMKKENFSLGLSIYRQLCLPIDKKLLCNYMVERVPSIKFQKNHFRILSFYEKTIVQVNYSNIIVKSSSKTPSIYQIFHIYHENIFVCNFKEEEFFFLDSKKKVGNLGK